MQKINVALIDNVQYCKFPKGINNITEFIEFLNENYHSFIELEFLIEEGCVAPFYIEEDLKSRNNIGILLIFDLSKKQRHPFFADGNMKKNFKKLFRRNVLTAFTTKRMPKVTILKGIVKKYPSMVNVGDMRRKTEDDQVFSTFHSCH